MPRRRTGRLVIERTSTTTVAVSSGAQLGQRPRRTAIARDVVEQRADVVEPELLRRLLRLLARKATAEDQAATASGSAARSELHPAAESRLANSVGPTPADCDRGCGPTEGACSAGPDWDGEVRMAGSRKHDGTVRGQGPRSAGRGDRAGDGEGGLKRAVGALDLTALGIGAVIGTGIFVVIGEGIGEAGPAVILSFALAGRHVRVLGALSTPSCRRRSRSRAARTPTPTPRSASSWRGSSAGT